jgi:hypothetical protein
MNSKESSMVVALAMLSVWRLEEMLKKEADGLEKH